MAKAVGEQARANGKQHIAAIQKLRRMRATHAHRQRMIFRERALGFQRGKHRRLRKFRKLQQLRHRITVVHALACVDKRHLGATQRFNGSADIAGIRAALPALHRHIGELLVIIFTQITRHD